MPKVAFALAILICTGSGRRVRSLIGELDAYAASQAVEESIGCCPKPRPKSRLASLLPETKPPAAFTTCGPGLHQNPPDVQHRGSHHTVVSSISAADAGNGEETKKTMKMRKRKKPDDREREEKAVQKIGSLVGGKQEKSAAIEETEPVTKAGKRRRMSRRKKPDRREKEEKKAAQDFRNRIRAKQQKSVATEEAEPMTDKKKRIRKKRRRRRKPDRREIEEKKATEDFGSPDHSIQQKSAVPEETNATQDCCRRARAQQRSSTEDSKMNAVEAESTDMVAWVAEHLESCADEVDTDAEELKVSIDAVAEGYEVFKAQQSGDIASAIALENVDCSIQDLISASLDVQKELELCKAEIWELTDVVKKLEAKTEGPSAFEENKDATKELEGIKPRPGRKTLEDLEVGMEIEGKVMGVQEFGIFLDFGATRQGLLHVSEMKNISSECEEFIVVGERFKKGDVVKARIKEIDRKKKMINLSCKDVKPESEFEVGMEVNGTIALVQDTYVLVEIGAQKRALWHCKDMPRQDGGFSNRDVVDPRYRRGTKVKCMIKALNQLEKDTTDGITLLTFAERRTPVEELEVGMVCLGSVRSVQSTGIMLDISSTKLGLLPIELVSPQSHSYATDNFTEGKQFHVQIQDIDLQTQRVTLTNQIKTERNYEQVFGKLGLGTAAEASMAKVVDLANSVGLEHPKTLMAVDESATALLCLEPGAEPLAKKVFELSRQVFGDLSMQTLMALKKYYDTVFASAPDLPAADSASEAAQHKQEVEALKAARRYTHVDQEELFRIMNGCAAALCRANGGMFVEHLLAFRNMTLGPTNFLTISAMSDYVDTLGALGCELEAKPLREQLLEHAIKFADIHEAKRPKLSVLKFPAAQVLSCRPLQFICIGIMGCGKSTTIRALAQLTGGNWLNQDEIGKKEREKFLSTIERATTLQHILQHSRPIFIDRVNTEKRHRSDIFSHLTKECLIALRFRHPADPPGQMGQHCRELCLQRLLSRGMAHRSFTVDPSSKRRKKIVKNVVRDCCKDFEDLSADELMEYDAVLDIDITLPVVQIVEELLTDLERRGFLIQTPDGTSIQKAVEDSLSFEVQLAEDGNEERERK